MSEASHDPRFQAIASGARARLPLHVALRAAALDMNHREARSLKALATKLEAGMDFESALIESRGQLPPHWIGLIRSGVRGGDLGHLLAEMSNYASMRRSIRRELFLALAYPVVMLIATILLAACAFQFILPPIEAMVREFETALDPMAQMAIAFGHCFVAAVWTIAMSFAAGVLLARWTLGRSRFAWLMTTVPVVGPFVWWIGTWEWLELLRQLILRDIALPDALRMTADAMSQANIAVASRVLADGVESGHSLQRLLQSSLHFPHSIGPLLGWGESNESLPDALRMASEAMAERVRSRRAWLGVVLPPLLFIVISIVVTTTVAAVILPLLTLVQLLS